MCRASCPDFFEEEKFRCILVSGLNLRIGWKLKMSGKYQVKWISHCLLLSETAFPHFFFLLVSFYFIWFGLSFGFVLFEIGCSYFSYTSKSSLLKWFPRSGWNQWFCLEENSRTTFLVAAWWRIFVLCFWQKLLPLLQEAKFESAHWLKSWETTVLIWCLTEFNRLIL